MKYRRLVLFGATIAVVALRWVRTAGHTGPQATTYTPPRTAWGDPDLQGIWRALTPVPLERPQAFAGREFLTDAEMAERDRQAEERRTQARAGKAEREGDGGLRLYNAITWLSEDRIKIARRTSAIIDPPDGRIPGWTPQQLKLWEAREAATRGRGDADSWEDRAYEERCIHVVSAGNRRNFGLGAAERSQENLGRPPSPEVLEDRFLSESTSGRPMKRIMQAPGYVVIASEDDNGYQIIPLDRPAPDPKVRQYQGVARGHWEGNTLVVVTTNINDKQNGGAIIQVDQGEFYPGTGETLRVTERYTRRDADTLDHQTTVEDPAVYVRPYTFLHEWTRDDKYKVSAYLCREGHDDMPSMLAAGRFDEVTALDNAADAERVRRLRLEELKAEVERSIKR